MAVLLPAIPIGWIPALLFTGITGTSPVMTSKVGRVASSHQDHWLCPSPVMAGPVPAIPIGKALRFLDRDHRHTPVMTLWVRDALMGSRRRFHPAPPQREAGAMLRCAGLLG